MVEVSQCVLQHFAAPAQFVMFVKAGVLESRIFWVTQRKAAAVLSYRGLFLYVNLQSKQTQSYRLGAMLLT